MARVDDLKFAAQTDKGNRREKNEDAFRVNERLRFVAVADGVGGQPAGEIASRLAVEQIEAYITSHIGEAPPLSTLAAAATLANDVIFQQGVHIHSGIQGDPPNNNFFSIGIVEISPDTGRF